MNSSIVAAVAMRRCYKTSMVGRLMQQHRAGRRRTLIAASDVPTVSASPMSYAASPCAYLRTSTKTYPLRNFAAFSGNGVMTEEVATLVRQHALQPQTSANLETLMKTGRGEFLHKTFGDDPEEHAATEKILIQVCPFSLGFCRLQRREGDEVLCKCSICFLQADIFQTPISL